MITGFCGNNMENRQKGLQDVDESQGEEPSYIEYRINCFYGTSTGAYHVSF